MITKRIALHLIALSLLVVPALAMTTPVVADGCSGQYGGGSCPNDLNVDKQVRNPITGVYVENLLSGDATYSQGSEVLYLLRITNSGNQTFETVHVSDRLPTQLTDAKVVDEDKSKVSNEKFENGILIFDLTNLVAGQTVDIHVKAKVKSGVFPSDKNPFCDVTNFVKVESEGRTDDDSAKLCVAIEQGKLPQAGPEDYLPLLPFLLLGITGTALFIKRG